MKNETVIEQILAFKDEVKDKLSNKNIITFKIKDMDFDDDRFLINDAVIEEKAVDKILSTMKVKNNFLDYKELLSPTAWNVIKTNLQEANSDTEFYGKKIQNVDNTYTVANLLKRKEVDSLVRDINFDRYFTPLTESLGKSNTDYEVKKLKFDDTKEVVNIKLLDQNGNIDIFNNDSDIWKRGINLQWDALNYSDAPFFERLVCTNGMTAETFGYKTNIQSKKFSYDQIVKQINKLVTKSVDKFDDLIQERCTHLRSNKVSANEFFMFRNLFKNNNENSRFDPILEKMFDDFDIYKAYGTNLDTKSPRWLATASSGRNGYDFLNDLTYINSHMIPDVDFRKLLSIKVSDFFFKQHLDLEDVAEPVDYNVGKVFTQNN